MGRQDKTDRGCVWPRFFAGMLAWTLVGCASQTPYITPETTLPDKYSVVLPVNPITNIKEHWWLDFRDQTLEHLVEEADMHNLHLAEERAKVKQAAASAASAGAIQDGDATLGGAANTDGVETVGLGLAIAFDPSGARRASRAKAVARLEAAKLGQVDRRRLVIRELASTYIEMRYLQQLLAYRRQDFQSLLQLKKDIERRLEGAGATRLDFARARALLSKTLIEMARIEAQVVVQRNRISTLIGRPAGMTPIQLGVSRRQPIPKYRNYSAAPADLVRNRPDIRQAERLYAAAVSNMDEARANRYPRLTLRGLILSPFSRGNSVGTLSGELAVPLFSQPMLKAEVELADAQALEALATWRRLVFQAVEEVENALAALQSASKSVTAAKQAVAFNEEALTLSKQIVAEGGSITILDVLQQEEDLALARENLALSTRDLGRNYVLLHTAFGTEITSTLPRLPPATQPAQP